MNSGYTKILWKTEELWKKYSITSDSYEDTVPLDISSNYSNGTSKYHKRFDIVETFDFTESKTVTFKDDYGSYKGLDRCQVISKNNKLIYLFDNHNEMLYPIFEVTELSQKKYNIVHIDAHPDDAKFQGTKKQQINLDNIENYIQETRISDFFDAISDVDLMGDTHRVCHSDDFEFFLAPQKSYILSLDIDIFGPEGNFCSLEDKVRAIALAWSRAEAVCIAMSPGFIDQGFAREVVEIFTK